MKILNSRPDPVQFDGSADRQMPLRVLLVSSSSGSRGGGELYLSGLAAGLTSLGHEVTSVMSDHSRMDELASLLGTCGPVRRIPYRNTYDRRLRSLGAVLARRDIKRIRRELVDLRPDVVHINKQNLEDGLDLLEAVRDSGCSAVVTIHVTRTMSRLHSVGGLLRDQIAARILRRASFPVIAIAQSGMADLQRMGIDFGRLRLVWNGVSASPSCDREAIRRAWNCSPKHVVVGCIARLEPQKNPLFLLPLLAQLPQCVRLVWIGDGSLMSSMRETALSLGISDRVILPGWQHDAKSFLPAFDIFALPSIYEGFPLAILEAMAAGLPCVVSDVDGVAEAVIDGETGSLCPCNAAAAWIDRLGSYVADPGARDRCGAAAAVRYRDHFSLEAMTRKTVNVYNEVVACSPRSSEW